MSEATEGNNGPTLEQVIECQKDRVDEMKKLDFDVTALNNTYIDILEQVSKKLDLLAMLADEVETDMIAFPQSMDEKSRTEFDLINQSALLSRYMCTKGLFCNALQAIQAMNQFGSTYISDRLVVPPPSSTDPPLIPPQSTQDDPSIAPQSTQDDRSSPLVSPSPSTKTAVESSEKVDDVPDAAKGIESAETLGSSDSDATVAARLDSSDERVNEDTVDVKEVEIPLREIVIPESTNETVIVEGHYAVEMDTSVPMEIEEMETKEEEEGPNHSNSVTDLSIDIPKESPRCTGATQSMSNESQLWSKRSEGQLSVADSVLSLHSSEDQTEKEKKKKKKKRKKRSKSSDKRRRSKEAEKMENILNKHLKRSREREERSRAERAAKHSDTGPSHGIMKRIEIVTISDDEPAREVKKARLERTPDLRTVVKKPIPGPATPPDDEDYENCGSSVDKGEMRSENQIMAPSMVVPHSTVSSVPQPVPPPILPVPLPVPPPILPFNLGCAPGFTRATMVEAQITPSPVIQKEEERPVSVADYTSERSEKEEKTDESKSSWKKKKKKDSVNSLKESIEEEIRLRERGHYSPERRGRSRSLSYSPRRSRSRSRERSNWRYGGVRERSRERGYDGWRDREIERERERDTHWRPRWRRWSRSPTRSRSRHRSYSRERDERRWSRSRSRSRSTSRGRSATPPSTHPSSNETHRRSCSPMPRSYARFRNRSSENGEKKRNEEKEKVKETEVINNNGENEVHTVSSEENIVPTKVTSPPPPLLPPSLHISTASSPSSPHSPSVFIPPPLILLPPKPHPLKIRLHTKKHQIGVSSSKSTSLTTQSTSSPANPATSLILDQVPLPSEAPPTRSTVVDTITMSRSAERKEDGSMKICGQSSLSDMSLEGNTGNSNTSIGEKGIPGLNRPTPPLSNPSADDKRQENVLPPPPRPPPIDHSTPPLDNTGTREINGHTLSTPSPTPLATTILKATVCPTNRSLMLSSNRQPLMGNGPSPPMQNMMYPQQYYPMPGQPNPYGPQQPWMPNDPSWQHHNFYYGQSGPMPMGGGYSNPNGMPHGPVPLPVPPPSMPQPSLINAMGVMRNQMQSGQSVNTIDWGQAAREHAIMAHQHVHPGLAGGIPPPPPMNQPHQLMGVPPAYGTPARIGSSRFRGGGGKGRRW